jgi:hypothetical protein
VLLPGPGGKVDLPALLNELARRGINEVHAEAGFGLSGSLLRAGLVDELLLYLAPCLIGDAARGMFDLPPLESLAGKAQSGDSRRPRAGFRSAPAGPLQLSAGAYRTLRVPSEPDAAPFHRQAVEQPETAKHHLAGIRRSASGLRLPAWRR